MRILLFIVLRLTSTFCYYPRSIFDNYEYQSEPVHSQLLHAYFGSYGIQMRHIIQAPLKGFLGFLGTLFFGTIFELSQGEDYNYDPKAVSIYNAYASKTSLTISIIKNFGLTASLILLWWSVALLFPPLCLKDGVLVPDNIGAIGPGTSCGLSRLSKEEDFSDIDTDVDKNVYDIIIAGMNQLFEPFAIVREIVATVMTLSSRLLFWAIVPGILSTYM